MSSTPRSDRKPKWRSLPLGKRPAPATSLSLIFAQPEQGTPLRSAIDNLPAVGIDDSASFMSEMSRKRERLQSISSAVTLADQQTPKEANGNVHKHSPVHSAAPEADAESVEAAEHDTDVREPTNVTDIHEETDVIDLTLDENKNSEGSDQRVLPGSPEALSTSPLPDPVSHVHAASPPDKSVPTRSSWFPSFSISRGKEKALVVPTAPQAPFQPANVTHEPQIDVGSAAPQSSAPIAVPPSVDPYEVEPATPHLASSPVNGTSNTASIASVDDEVPRPKSMSGSPGDQSSLAETVAASALREDAVKRKPSMTTLNGTSSGFMLRLPLLGRPKMPLNQVVAAAKGTQSEAPVVETEGPPTEPTEQVPQEPDSGASCGQAENINDSVRQGLQDSSAASLDDQDMRHTTPAPEIVEAKLPQEAPSKPAPSYTWWDYLGFGGDSAAGTELPDTSVKSDTATIAQDQTSISINQGAQQEPSTSVAPPKSTSCPDLPAMSASPNGLEPQQPKPNLVDHVMPRPEPSPGMSSEPAVPLRPTSADSEPQERPASPTSTEVQTSAWYSPLAWYYGSHAPSTKPVMMTDTSEAVMGTDSRSEANGKTESELIKEEAMARDSPAVLQPVAESESKPDPAVTPSANEPANPIESSISNNRSGWASFFMSKTLLMKTITDVPKDRDENGMEVMHIDDADDEPRAETAAIPAKPPQSPIASTASVHGKEVEAQQKKSDPASLPISPTQGPPVKQREPKKSTPPAPPLTNSESVKRDTNKPRSAPGGPLRTGSPTPSQKSTRSTQSSPVIPSRTQQPNLVLPAWSDTFHTPPRSYVSPPPKPAKSRLSKTISFVSHALWSGEGQARGSIKGKEREASQPELVTFGQELPKALGVLNQTMDPNILHGHCRVVVIGIAGWSPGAVTRTIAGGLPSSSSKFVDMTCAALEKFEQEHDVKFKKITKVPLEGDGTISRKVAKVHAHLISKQEWIEDLHLADVIFIAGHSQGSIVSIHLLDRLIREGHILTPRNVDILTSTASMIAPGGAAPASTARTQKICCLALCGIHLGPLRYLKTSSLLQPYIQYFENAAARELFEFQNTESRLSRDYIDALRTVIDHGAKLVYVASLNDQVVPIYSGLFTAASHPRILRALYIDGDAYHSSDFLSNLLVLLIRIMNAGLSDSGLIAHLSEATAGTLSGVGHSTAYEELGTFSLAVEYMFMANDGADVRTDLVIEPFNAVNEQNDYEIPWSLRDLIADERVAQCFAKEFSQLRDAFDDWVPKTTILRDIKRKLQPIQRLSVMKGRSFSKL